MWRVISFVANHDGHCLSCTVAVVVNVVELSIIHVLLILYRYVVHSFNCYLYPCTFGPYDTRFVCQVTNFG